MPGKVAVQVDPVGVLACVRGHPVRVEVGDDPHRGAGRARQADQAAGDRDPGGLVAVNAADDQHWAGLARVADLDRLDRAFRTEYPIVNARFVTTATPEAHLVAVAPRCVARAWLPQPETATSERTAAAICLPRAAIARAAVARAVAGGAAAR